MLKTIFNNLKCKKRENGQAMVEFVLVIPVFIVLFYFMFWATQVFCNKMTAQTAAASACRSAIVCSTKSDAKAKAKSAISTALSSSSAVKGKQITFNAPTKGGISYTRIASSDWYRAYWGGPATSSWKKKKKLYVNVQIATNGMTSKGSVKKVSATMCMEVENDRE